MRITMPLGRRGGGGRNQSRDCFLPACLPACIPGKKAVLLLKVLLHSVGLGISADGSAQRHMAPHMKNGSAFSGSVTFASGNASASIVGQDCPSLFLGPSWLDRLDLYLLHVMSQAGSCHIVKNHTHIVGAWKGEYRCLFSGQPNFIWPCFWPNIRPKLSFVSQCFN